MSRTRVIVNFERRAKVVQQGSPSFSAMYSDRISSGGAGNRKRSVKDRLGGNVDNFDNYPRQDFNKRFRGNDEKWQHDMYDEVDNGSIAKSEQISTQDLRAKLKKSAIPVSRGGNETYGGVKDLREKLSGSTPVTQTRTQTVSMPQQRSSSDMKAATQGVTSISGSKPAAAKPSVAQKVPTGAEAMTVSSFLQSLGLSKYSITFQAEEIDMSVLRLMKDEELKELGIPMGPRKKILLALASQSQSKR